MEEIIVVLPEAEVLKNLLNAHKIACERRNAPNGNAEEIRQLTKLVLDARMKFSNEELQRMLQKSEEQRASPLCSAGGTI